MNFDMNEVLNGIFQDGIKELNTLYATAESKRSEYARTFAPDVAERKWADLKKYHQSCKDSIIRTETRKLQEALAPIRDYWDESLSEYDPAIILKVADIADLALTETEYAAAARIAGNSYWGLCALVEKTPDSMKDKVSRPDIEQYRFILDTLENRIITTWANFEGTGAALDSIGQIASVDAMNMPLQINQAIERINSICPAFFSTEMLSSGEALTPNERDQIAVLAETEFTGPACDPSNIGNSICNYIEANPADKGMVMRSKFGPIATEYEQEFSEARRINRLNRDIHNAVVSTKR